MGYTQTFQRNGLRFIQCAAMAVAMVFAGTACRAQSAPPRQDSDATSAKDLKYNPELVAEFGRLFTKLQNEIQSPAPRSESRLLALLPPSTMFYGAFPNYGEVTNELLNSLHQELQTSQVFRDWWQSAEMAAAGPKIEDALQKFNQLEQYLGEEMVISGTADAKNPSFLMVAQVRKPGLKKFLQQMDAGLNPNSKSRLSVLDPQELAAASANGPQQPVVLVRPDFAVFASNLVTLRSFNARLDQSGREFSATPFGRRVLQEYQSGVTIVGAADLHRAVNQAPPAAEQNAAFQQSGFADMKYLVWENRKVAGKSVSQLELSFNGPRHGAAAWLAKSSRLGSLDFVSPEAPVTVSLVLANPAQIFDDVKGLVSISNPNAFAAVPAFEQAMHLSVKDDLLDLLRGEITFELDSVAPLKPAWRAVLGVKDAKHLQQTLSTLIATAHFQSEQTEEDGLTWYVVRIPNPKGAMEIHYAFADGYWIIGSSSDAVADSVRLHRSGGSLAKSKKLFALLPPGRTLEASALIYEDPITMAMLQMQRVSPELADSLAQNHRETTPVAVWIYGEDAAIREVSSNPALDVGVVMAAAAIAIPNLLRSKVAANEASAVASLRTLNSAQATYASGNPQRGFARTLAQLGRGTRGTAPQSAGFADLLNDSLVSGNCSVDGSCTRDGFRFKISAVCEQLLCRDYVAYAVPADSSTGTRNFCSTSDGVIRSSAGPPRTGYLSVTECQTWQPIQ